MNNVEKILEWIRTVDKKTLPYDIVGLGWGPKISNGVETGENCIIFTVIEKKSLDTLEPEQIIPKYFTVEINGNLLQARTDVVEPTLCSKLQYCNINSNSIDPVKQHRIKRNNIMGGIETMTDWGNYVGTLGILVQDKTDGSVVALSNNHIFANSQLTASFKTPNDMGGTSLTSISAYQPTGFYRTTPSNDYIGSCKRAVLIGNGNPDLVGMYIGETTCDAAILNLKDYTIIDTVSSPNILNFNQLAPYKFATDAEIDSLAPGGSNQGAPIFRSGRTLGAIGYPGVSNMTCSLSVYELNWALVGLYSGYVSFFSDCFYVRGQVYPGAGGDSGSAMFALFNGNNPSLSAWKCIGLLFAGPENMSYTIGCRITNIVSELQIKPWDTKMPTLTSRLNTFTEEDFFVETANLSGRKYYQVGYTN